MINFLKKLFGLVSSFLIIYACLLIGKYLAGFLPFVFPGSIIGLLILFVLLKSKRLKSTGLCPQVPSF
jgi:holin-like protein